nr:MAG TPA: hypothetical protein [Caudoviricetes sp.]
MRCGSFSFWPPACQQPFVRLPPCLSMSTPD